MTVTSPEPIISMPVTRLSNNPDDETFHLSTSNHHREDQDESLYTMGAGDQGENKIYMDFYRNQMDQLITKNNSN